jgi:hypothetical protein
VDSVSTEPRVFVREHIRLNDTTNFTRAGNFFLSAISSAFLAEVATLHLLGIGNLAEPYYWLCILLTSIPFVLICFLLVRLVVPLPFKDVLHLSFYPIGAGIFAGAVFALVASAVVALLVATGSIPDIKFDFSQWGEQQQGEAVFKRVIYDCLKGESLLLSVVASGFGEAYTNLKPPIDALSYLRPLIAVLYLFIAARFFMVAVDRRKPMVFGVVVLAAILATVANYFTVKAYFHWKGAHTSCKDDKIQALGDDRFAESALKEIARTAQKEIARITAQKEIAREETPIVDMVDFYHWVAQRQQSDLKDHCSAPYDDLKAFKAMETHTFYSVEGERLTSYSIRPAVVAPGRRSFLFCDDGQQYRQFRNVAGNTPYRSHSGVQHGYSQ